MTFKELVDFTGKTERTVRNWIKKADLQGCEKNAQGYAIDYNIDDIEKILNAGSMSRDAVIILMGNARRNIDNNSSKDLQVVVDSNNNFNMKMFADMMASSLAVALKPIYDRLDSVENNAPLQIEHVPEKTSRAIFKQEVDKLVKLSKSDWSAIYNAVYAEMGYVYGVKIKARANNRKVRPIDVLESDGLMGKAIAITRQMIERFEA